MSDQAKGLRLGGWQDSPLPELLGAPRRSCLSRPMRSQRLPDAGRSWRWPEVGLELLPRTPTLLGSRPVASQPRGRRCHCTSAQESARCPVPTLARSAIQLGRASLGRLNPTLLNRSFLSPPTTPRGLT